MFTTAKPVRLFAPTLNASPVRSVKIAKLPKQIRDQADPATALLMPADQIEKIKLAVKKISEDAIRLADEATKSSDKEDKTEDRNKKIKYRLYSQKEIEAIVDFKVLYPVYYNENDKTSTEIMCFVLPEPLGEGNNGTVLLAHDLDHPEKVYALKEMDKEHYKPEEFKHGHKASLIIAQSLPLVLDGEEDKNEEKDNRSNYIFLMKFLSEHTLFHYIHNLKDDEEIDFDIMINMFKEIQTRCIDRKMLHRDIKLPNFMLDRDEKKSTPDSKKVFAVDFGSAIDIKEDEFKTAGPGSQNEDDYEPTMGYTAPETLLYNNSFANEQSEIFSLGICVAEMTDLIYPSIKDPDRPDLKVESLGTRSRKGPTPIDRSLPLFTNNKRIKKPEIRTALLDAIELMTQRDYRDRPGSIKACITFLEGLKICNSSYVDQRRLTFSLHPPKKIKTPKELLSDLRRTSLRYQQRKAKKITA